MQQKAGLLNVSETFPPTGTPVAGSLSTGLKGKFEFGNVEIVGRVCYRSAEGFRWNEWALKTSTGEFHWLKEEENHFIYLRPYLPAEAILPESFAAGKINFDGNHVNILEDNMARIVFLEGTLPGKPSLGEQFHYVNAAHINKYYSVKWDEHDLYCYKGEKLNNYNLYKSFSLHHMNKRERDLYIIAGTLLLFFIFGIFLLLALN